MFQKIFAYIAAIVCLATVACGDKSQNPVSPTASLTTTSNVTSDAAEDGSTLKATAPTPQSPIDGVRLETFRPRLIVGNSTPLFASGVTFSYRFQVIQAGRVVKESTLVPQGAGSTGWTLTSDLESDLEYQWRARAEFSGAVGPWSEEATFLSPEKREGYMIPGELYDPLIDGKTVGKIVGSVTFIPGLGVRLNDFTSHIRYELPQTVVRGEFSILVTNMATNNEGNKTKVMAMSEGSSDIVTNNRRMTVEKRGDPRGVIAWRFISHLSQIETVGKQRVKREFNPSVTYFWKTTWNGRFTVQIYEGGVRGRQIYDFGKPYNGAYDPEPHYAYIGAPVGRSGVQGSTVPGMIIRQVWLSTKPRPEFANK